ncbi:diguanylate cyclase [Kutzneria viridogrisea]|uniref:Two component signal transduction response regulator n=2 Tax=Kutzneria TaxID=43356 RepID=W5W1M6_9PSEU|nr:EAL domain-containing protein [Kutzneria albida]AHH94732.1 two component signal transduction response regulator [Kutzneria albida DSM 43870]MBA8930401.1 PAS domain S-box-containing protein/diguanylate cyclase (GGDEF)-like protein [Kutzneria viridogrisea]
MNDDPEQHGTGTHWRVGLARAWAEELSTTVFVPMSQARVERMLAKLVDLLVDALCADPFDTGPLGEVGAELVARSISGRTTLPTTLGLLGTRLLAMPAELAPADLPERVVGVLSAVAGGYAEALRERTFIGQESLKTSLVQAKRDTERTLAESEARLRAIFSSSAVGIAISEPDGRFLQTNESLREILGYDATELSQMTMQDLLHPDAAGDIGACYAEVLADRRRRFRERGRLTRKDGEAVWAYLAVSVLRDDAGAPTHVVTMVEDVTELHLLGDRLGHQSLHDALTGLPNRQYFMSTVEGVLGGEPSSSRITLFHFGLDRFTVVNDGLGQHIGDRLLRAVGKRLEEVFAEEKAMVARLGGDEFAVLLESSEDTPGVTEFIGRTMARLAEPVYLDGDGLAVTTCVGIVDRVAHGTDPIELLRAGDMTLHRAKRRGAGQWDLYDPQQDSVDRDRFRLAATIPGALQHNQLDALYQPVLRLSDESILALTTRVTWTPPGRPLHRHDAVLALAEETGVVLPVGRWLMERACEQTGAWRDRFGDRVPPVVVDLSPSQARDPDLVGVVRHLLGRSGLDASWLRLGFVLAGDAQDEEIIDNVMVLAEMGLGTVLYRFGSEHVDLLQAMEFPLNGVVLDRKLTDSLVDEHAALVTTPVVTALVDFVHSCGLPVAALGVSSEGHLQRLRSVGVDAGQGEVLVPSSPATAITERLSQLP